MYVCAQYRRRIPVLTETAALAGYSSARVCGNNQKRCTPGFAARTERGADCTLIIVSPVRWWKKPEHSVLTGDEKKAAGGMRHEMARIEESFFSLVFLSDSEMRNQFEKYVRTVSVFSIFLWVLLVEWPVHGAGRRGKRRIFVILSSSSSCL